MYVHSASYYYRSNEVTKVALPPERLGEGFVRVVVSSVVDESDGNTSRGNFSLSEAIDLANTNLAANLVTFENEDGDPQTYVLLYESVVDGDTMSGKRKRLRDRRSRRIEARWRR